MKWFLYFQITHRVMATKLGPATLHASRDKAAGYARLFLVPSCIGRIAAQLRLSSCIGFPSLAKHFDMLN
ncbi:uncharacterized protein J3R85_001211 [Psidium guajava]|nr:uncharacterized protein J3R85_001211 [Psidium guajava]